MNIKRYIINRYTKYFIGQIPLYHTCYDELPPQINCHIHNVKPEDLFKQLTWLKENFDIVTLEKWFQKKYKGGYVAVTFDDAYKSFFDNALPIFEELNIPVAVFVVGSTLEGEIFWRDKIRFIVCSGLANNFVNFFKNNYQGKIVINEHNFYKLSKSKKFLKQVTNKELNQLLDDFLLKEEYNIEIEKYCIERIENLPDHPLVTYGNHSFRHYLLSSLSDEELKDDLSRNQEIINMLKPRKTTSIFSIPFGRRSSINKQGIEICRKLGMKGLLLSNNRLNGSSTLDELYGLPVAYRFMAPETLKGLKGKVHSMTYSKMKKSHPNK